MDVNRLFEKDIIIKIGFTIFLFWFSLGYLIYYSLQPSEDNPEYKRFTIEEFYEAEFDGKFTNHVGNKRSGTMQFTIDSVFYTVDYYPYIELKDSMILKRMETDLIKYYSTGFSYRKHRFAFAQLRKIKTLRKKKNSYCFLADTIPLYLFLSAVDSNTPGAIRAPELFKKVISLIWFVQ